MVTKLALRQQRLSFFKEHDSSSSSSSSSSDDEDDDDEKERIAAAAAALTNKKRRREETIIEILSDDDIDNDNDDDTVLQRQRQQSPTMVDLLSSDDDDDDRKMPASRISESPQLPMPKFMAFLSSDNDVSTTISTPSHDPTTTTTAHTVQSKSKSSTTAATTSAAATAATTTTCTLESWLKNKSKDDVERINAEFLKEAEEATTAECTNTSSSTTLLSSTIQNKDLSNLSRAEFKELNDLAERNAMAGPVPINVCYTKQDFLSLMKKASNHFLDATELEFSPAIRKANRTMTKNDSTDQTRAQYGRTMPTAGTFLLEEIGNLTMDMIFCDIGHGIGNLVHQAAYTYGCESRGIEMVGDRCDISKVYDDWFQLQHKLVSDRTGEMRHVGQARLRHGRLEEPIHREFLTSDGAGVDLLYCNNFNGVFSHRSNDKQVTWCLDDYIAGLFTQLKPGAKLVTLSEIGRLPPPLAEANELRLKNGLAPSSNASYYTLDVIDDPGGQGKLTFTEKAFKFYIYTRVGTATYLCDACDGAPISASQLLNEGGDHERLITVICCPHCQHQKRGPTRERVTPKRYVPPAQK